MHIQCTKKMLDWLKPEMTVVDVEDDLFAWHAKYQIVNRKKFVVFTHNLSRFCVLVYGLNKSDFKDIHIWFPRFLRNSMQNIGMDDLLIEKYISDLNEVTYNKTNNRSLITRLNMVCEYAIYYMNQPIYVNLLQQPQLELYLNDTLVGEKSDKGYFIPHERFNEYLETLYR